MTATAWALVAAALLLAGPPGRRRASAPGQHRPARAARPGHPGGRPMLELVAPLAVAGGCVALAGLPVGAVLAAVAGPGCSVVVRRQRRRAPRAGPDASVPLVLDLAAAALRAGRPLPDALELAAPAGSPLAREALVRVARLLRLGAEPGQAWGALARDDPLGALAPVAVRSATSGLRLAAAFERLAEELRADRAAAAAAGAHRAGVLALAPLAACFLPSFVCLGVVPVVVGVASTAIGLPP